MSFCLASRFLNLFLFSMLLVVNMRYCDCKALSIPGSKPGFMEQVYDVATGRRDLEINGNILDGDVKISTSYTLEEKMTMVAIGCGILLALAFCCVFCKQCCCPSKRSTVIVYQQMPSARPPRSVNPRVAPNSISVIPLHNQGIVGMQSQLARTSPPPPYPGFCSQNK